MTFSKSNKRKVKSLITQLDHLQMSQLPKKKRIGKVNKLVTANLSQTHRKLPLMKAAKPLQSYRSRIQ